MSKTKTQVLGGHIYVVEHVDGIRRVHKVTDDKNKQIYEVDRDGVCECPAGEHGRDCKHVRMAFGELEGHPFSRPKARRMLEAWIERARGEVAHAKFVNLVRYKKGNTVKVATALATNFQVGCEAERFTLWTEIDGLLIRIHVFKDPETYREAHTRARSKR